MKAATNKNLWAVTTVLLVTFVSVGPAAGDYSEWWLVKQITDTDYDDVWTDISGANIVWMAKMGGGTSDDEIFLYDGLATTRLTYNSLVDRQPRVSGSNVVWERVIDLQSEIYFYDGSITRLTNNDYDDKGVRISGKYVTWTGWTDGQPPSGAEIFLYDGDTVTQLTDNDYTDGTVAISGSHVAWQAEWDVDIGYEIYHYDGGPVTRLTFNSEHDNWVDVSGDNLVWMGWDGSDNEIFFHDGSTTTQLTHNGYIDKDPKVSGRNVVWVGAPGSNLEVFYYDGSTVIQVTNNSHTESPQISGSYAVWDAYLDSCEIFFYDGKTVMQVTDTGSNALRPRISGRNVVWQASDGHDFELFLARTIYNMHWPQTPKAGGFDVDFESSVMLGDDWRCTETGPVKDIRLWASWKENVVGSINGMRVKIYSDQPAGLAYSRPKDVLWEREFNASELTVEPMNPNWQGWYEPNGPNAIAHDHDQWCQIDITDIASPFTQQAGEIYWLVITDVDVNGGQLGWKETDKNFNDVAVWYNIGIPSWQPILDPWFGGPIDLAFVIMDVPRPPQELDFGDAPNPPYLTLLNFGARHVVVDGVYLGSGVDSEINGQPDTDALGDDNDGNDDEDGVAFFGPLEVGHIVTVGVTASVEGFLDAWIDFDADGSWLETYDRIFTSEPLAAGLNTLHFEVPSSAAVAVPIYARFRFSTGGGLSFDGPAEDGEVEDYRIYFDIGAEPEVKNAKWSQPPVETDLLLTSRVYCGWDEQSYTPYSGSNVWKLVADDYRCIGDMPVTSVHWWGSYYGWEGEPELTPTQPIGWRIGFWSNVQADPCGVPYSHPSELLWLIDLPFSRVNEEQVGQDFFPRHPSDICFKHSVELSGTEFFLQSEHLDQTADDIFWISIGAVYETSDVTYPWGWKTRPWHWMDDSVTILLNDDIHVPMTVDPNAVTPIKYEQESFDVAFALDTDPSWVKWEQAFTGLRDWPFYEDVNSWAKEDKSGNLVPDPAPMVSDDWLCRRRTPVTAIVWWGSYIKYTYEACQWQSVAPSSIKPDYFLIRIWTDSPRPFPLGFSHPAKPVWEYKAYDYDEVLVGYDKYPSSKPAEPVFRYSVKLPEADWFYQRKNSAVYWISIVAVYVQREPEFEWGWTNHPHSFNDYAVKGWWEDPANWNWQVLKDQMGNGEDMSFMLFTTPNDCTNCADYDFDNLVTYSDLDVFTNDWLWIGPPGGYSDGDLDCDGDSDFHDYAILAFQWLDSCP